MNHNGTAKITDHLFRKLFRHHYVLMALVVAAGVATSALLALSIRNAERKQLQAAFNRASEDRISVIRRGIDESLQELESISAFYAASESVERGAFHAFVRPFLVDNPSIQALEWAPRVPFARRAAFEKAARGAGFSGFQITESASPGVMTRAGKRREYFPVSYVEPYLKNEASLGFDLSSEPTRRAALLQARDTGAMVATGRIRLVQETARQYSFLVVHPVYRNGAIADSEQSRRANLAGFAIGVFRIGDMMEQALSYLQRQDIEIRFYDDTAEKGNAFLYAYPQALHVSIPHRDDDDKAPYLKGLHYAETIDVAGRKWTFLCLPTPQYIAGRRSWHPWEILGGGLALTGVLAGYILLIVRGAQETQKLADQVVQSEGRLTEEMTERILAEKTLRASEEKFRLLFYNSPLGIFNYDVQLRITDCNSEFAATLKTNREEIIGLDMETLKDKGVLPAIRKALGGETGFYEGTYRARSIPAGISIVMHTAPLVDHDGAVRGGVGIVEDVTERKRSEEALRQSEQRYRSLFENMVEGYAYCKMLYDDDQPRDFVYLAVNDAFAALTGLQDVVGKKVSEVIPGIREEHPELFETYGRVAATGKPERFEIHSDSFGGWLAITVYSVERGYFTAVFDNVTERKQRERELETIAMLGVALRSAATRDEQVPVVLDHVMTLLSVGGAALGMVDPETGDIVIEGARGAWSHWTGTRLTRTEGIMGRCVTGGTTCTSDDALNEADVFRPELLQGLRTLACVPLIADNRTIGALMAGRDERIVQAEIRLLLAIGEIAAVAIHRLALHSQTVQQIHHLAALHDIDVAISSSVDLRLTLGVLLRHVTEELSVDAAAVLLLNPHTQILTYAAGHGLRTRDIEGTRIRLGEGCAGRAALERRVVSVGDAVRSSEKCDHVQMLKGEDFVSHYVAPLIVKGQVKGVLEVFKRSPLQPERAWLDFFEALAGQAAIAVDSAALFADLQRANDELVLAYDATIEGWARALDYRDKETEGHSRRVTEITVQTCRAVGMGDDEMMYVRWGALLHDIGKLGVPDSILFKPGKLDDDEWRIMKRHPVIANELLRPIRYLGPAVDVPYCHHEKWDGTGYPRGLKGEQIPLAARVFAAVDIWDALRSDRPYRPAWPEEKVTAHIRSLAGNELDPEVVDVFLTQMRNHTSKRSDNA